MASTCLKVPASMRSTNISLPANLVDRFTEFAQASTACQTLRPSESLRYSLGPSAMTAIRIAESLRPDYVSSLVIMSTSSLFSIGDCCDCPGSGSGGSSTRGITGSEQELNIKSPRISDRTRTEVDR